MKFSLEDPTFLTVLLIAVAVFAVVLISVAVFLVFKSRKKSDDAKPEAEKKKKRWNPFPPEVPGMKESFRAAMQRLRETCRGTHWSGKRVRAKRPWPAFCLAEVKRSWQRSGRNLRLAGCCWTRPS